MVAAVRKETQALILVMVGATAIKLVWTDTYLNFVKPSHGWMVAGAGVALVVLAFFVALGTFGKQRSAATRADDAEPDAAVAHLGQESGADGHGHDHSHGPRVGWLLLLPVLAVFLVAPPALGSYAASRDSGRVAEPRNDAFEPLPAGDPVELSVLDYATRAVWGKGGTLEGRTVEMVGFVTPGEDGADWYLTRMMLNCCAADGQAVKIEVQGVEAPPENSWVTVTGTWVDNGTNPRTDLPAVAVESLEPADEPRNPYVSY